LQDGFHGGGFRMNLSGRDMLLVDEPEPTGIDANAEGAANFYNCERLAR
jgi:hypothetical protein